jgi:hypothetical protein
MVAATAGMPVRPLPLDDGEGVPVASSARPNAPGGGGLIGGLESLLHSIFGGDAPPASAQPYARQ